MEINKCAITGQLLKPGELKPLFGQTIEYETDIIGKVKITLVAYSELLTGSYERFIIGGICKNLTIEEQEPILIDSNFISAGYKAQNILTDFKAKGMHLLKRLYMFGGRENKEFELNSTKHCYISYSSPEEFSRIIDYLDTEHLISIRKTHRLAGLKGNYIYMGLTLTKYGREESEKFLPQIPLVGLVNEEIATGNLEIDLTINHARKLFFEEPVSLDKMRSACESLSYILEPLRKDLSGFFLSADVSDFFNIVNNFDIRHNKANTKNLVHPEQLEWVFYSLLNTINTYSKLKAKLVNGNP